MTAFHAEHKRRYGYDQPFTTVEIVTLRVTAIGELPNHQVVVELAQASGLEGLWFVAQDRDSTPAQQEVLRRAVDGVVKVATASTSRPASAPIRRSPPSTTRLRPGC